MGRKNGCIFENRVVVTVVCRGTIMAFLYYLVAHKILLMASSFQHDNSSMNEADNLVRNTRLQDSSISKGKWIF